MMGMPKLVISIDAHRICSDCVSGKLELSVVEDKSGLHQSANTGRVQMRRTQCK
jgi:hypothetical protein